MSGDFDIEPIPGLPEVPPPGERILWQGKPEWRDLARHAFHADKIAAYFALLVTLRFVLAVRGGQSVTQALASYGLLLAAGCAAVTVIVGFAYLSARSTVYTLTNKRIAMRFGIALPLTVNLPLSQVERADLARRGGGTGDVSVGIMPGQRIAYLVLWPHARAWHINSPQPSFRSVRDVGAVAGLLGEALAELHAHDSKSIVRVRLVNENAEPSGTFVQPSLEAAE